MVRGSWFVVIIVFIGWKMAVELDVKNKYRKQNKTRGSSLGVLGALMDGRLRRKERGKNRYVAMRCYCGNRESKENSAFFSLFSL